MQAIRSALRRQLFNSSRLRPATPTTTTELWRRHQHANNNYGPHKEYFQIPGQVPLPDTTPYDPRQPIVSVPAETGPSRFASAFRGIFWAVLFNTIGIATGVAFITWEYLQPPYEPGSPEEKDLLEEIQELLDTHPVVLGLREQGWTEEEFYMRRALSDRERGHNLIHETLQGSSQTLNVKSFKDQSKQYTFLIFFVGFGLDGFPDVMHGGVTASMMLEAMNKHLANYCSDMVLNTNQPSIDIDYKTPVRPGEIYTIMVPPGTLEPDGNDHSKLTIRLAALLLRLDELPELTSEWDPRTNSMVHKVEIHSSSGKTPHMASASITVPVVERSKPLGFAKPPTFTLTANDSKQHQP